MRDSPKYGPESSFASEGVVAWPLLGQDGRTVAKPGYWALLALAAMPLPAP